MVVLKDREFEEMNQKILDFGLLVNALRAKKKSHFTVEKILSKYTHLKLSH